MPNCLLQHHWSFNILGEGTGTSYKLNSLAGKLSVVLSRYISKFWEKEGTEQKSQGYMGRDSKKKEDSAQE